MSDAIAANDNSHIDDDEVKEYGKRPSVLVSTIDLCNTIMGTGLVSIPYAFATVGLGYGIIITLLSSAATWFSLRLLVSSAQFAYQTGRVPSSTSSFAPEGEPTYSSLATVILGKKGALWTNIAMALSCLGFAVSYLVAIGDSMPHVVGIFISKEQVGPWLFSILEHEHFWMLLFLIVILPLCFANSVDEFWWFSATALGCALYLSGIILFHTPYAVDPPEGPIDSVPWFDLKLDGFEAISLYIFAFTCHQNIFSVYGSIGAFYDGQGLSNDTIKYIKKVIDLSILFVTILYLAVGSVGYTYFKDDVKILVLDNFPDDVYSILGRFMYALLAALSVPIQVHPCRLCIDSFIGLSTNHSQSRFEYERIYDDSERRDDGFVTKLLRNLRPLMRHETSQRILLTTGILCVTYFIAFWIHSLDDIMGFVGGTCGVIACFIMPAIFYSKLTTFENGGWRRPFSAILAVISWACGTVNIGWLIYKNAYDLE